MNAKKKDHKKIPDPIEEIKQELEESKNKYLQLLAELENSRKRMIKEKHNAMKYATKDLALEMIPPIEQMSIALNASEQSSDEVKNWALGFKMILQQFKDSLSQHDIRPFDSLGKPYDPHFHEAMESIESQEHEPGHIIREFVRGYTMGDQVILAAQVQVAKQSSPEETNKEETGDSHVQKK